MNAILAIAGTFIVCADHNTICARCHLTTDPELRLTIPRSLFPSIVEVTNLHTFNQHPVLRDKNLQVVDATHQRVASHATSFLGGRPSEGGARDLRDEPTAAVGYNFQVVTVSGD